MIFQFLIIIFVAPNLLLQTLANTKKPKTESDFNSTIPPSEETSYFYRDPQGPGTYEFGYHIEDEKTANTQFRQERRYANGTITGSYGYLRPDGKMTITNYVADEKGYRKTSKITKKPASSSTTTTESTASLITADDVTGLNLTAGTLPPQLVEDVMNKYDIDLSPNASPSDILHPNISDIIAGKVPLKSDNKTSKLGFEVVHNFIPNDFPIVPFELPQELPHKSADD